MYKGGAKSYVKNWSLECVSVLKIKKQDVGEFRADVEFYVMKQK